MTSRVGLPFTKILNQLMAERGMKVREAARIARVGASTITSWRAGAHPMDLLAVRRLADALGVSFSFLLTGEPDRTEPPTSIANLFEEREVFSGYARVTIHELAPRAATHCGSRQTEAASDTDKHGAATGQK